MKQNFSKKLVADCVVKHFRDGKSEERKFYPIREGKHNIFVNGKRFTSVVFLPEYHKEFTYGFLFTSGIIKSKDDVVNYRMCEYDNIYVYLKDISFDVENIKNWTITPGCGGGKVLEKTYSEIDIVENDLKISPSDIFDIFLRVENDSGLHSLTRCVHKAFFKSSKGLAFKFDDVGRHNTIDKIIGAVLLSGESDFSGVIFTTGRLTSEMILKCAKAKIPVILSRTAPSENGIKIAEKSGITLVGLVSKNGFDVFTKNERVLI